MSSNDRFPDSTSFWGQTSGQDNYEFLDHVARQTQEGKLNFQHDDEPLKSTILGLTIRPPIHTESSWKLNSKK
jgi:hypothetical protein